MGLGIYTARFLFKNGGYVTEFEDLRLNARYRQLVLSHMNCTSALAAAPKALPNGVKAFAHVQALWRFLANPRVTPAALAAPLLQAAHEAVALERSPWVLCVHDWSRLNYRRHTGKRDQLQMTHQYDMGYELQSSLLVSSRTGAPLGAPAQNLVTAQGTWQWRQEQITPGKQTHLDELTERMAWLQQQEMASTLVHVIDREADSVAHIRRWNAQNMQWLIRAKAASSVRHEGQSMRIDKVAAQLKFEWIREVQHKGQPAQQYVASAPVVLARAAKPKKSTPEGKRCAPVAGEPVAARLVVSRLYDAQGKELAQWYLLTSLPASVDEAQVALWYYFRWQIESFFKLLKQAGLQLESWEQESGCAIFKRLLIATQACTLVWQLAARSDEDAVQTQHFLVRLSGRQLKRARPVTMPALLDGAFKLLAMLDALQHYSVEQLREFAHTVINGAINPAEKEHRV